MLFGKYASRASEAKYPSLWRGLVGAWSPGITGPTGVRAFDLSGRNNNGTATNVSVPTFWSRSQGRWGWEFDGVDDVVNFDSKTGDLTETIPFTVSAWGLAKTTGYFRGIISRDQSVPYAFSVRFTGGSQLTLVTNGVVLIGPTITTNTWFHVTVVLAESLRQIFFNGILATQSTTAYSIASNADILRIGSDFNPDSTRVWDGFLDDILIHNRALSHSEIRRLASRRGVLFEKKKLSFARLVEKKRRRNNALVGLF